MSVSSDKFIAREILFYAWECCVARVFMETLFFSRASTCVSPDTVCASLSPEKLKAEALVSPKSLFSSLPPTSIYVERSIICMYTLSSWLLMMML